MYNEMKVSFLSKKENVAFARGIAISFLVGLDLELCVVNEIKTIISEGITNAIVHGYDDDETKFVELKMSYDNFNIYIVIHDSGKGIEDIEKAREPLFSTKIEEERAGLGFTIMEVFSDKLEIKSSVNQGTELSITKKYYEQGH